MRFRVLTGSDSPALDQRLPDGCAVPRAGETVAMRDPLTGDVRRWSVKTVVWDYAGDEPSVDIHVSANARERVPSYAVYTD